MSNNQLNDFNRRLETVFANAVALRFGEVRLQMHFLRFDTLEPGFHVTEHVHPNYEIAFVRRGGMTTRFDNLRVENSRYDDRMLLIPPSVPHSRDFTKHEPTVNQSWAFTLTAATLRGEAAIQQFNEIIRQKQFSLELTQEMMNFLRTLDRQALRHSAIAIPMAETLTHGLLLSIFDIYFPALPESAHPGPGKFREFGNDRVAVVKAFVEYSINSNCPLEECARLGGVGMRHLSRIFEAATGSSIHVYYTRRRVEIARRELLFSDRSIAGIANSMHFGTPGSFSRFFRQHTGVSPVEFRKNGTIANLLL